MKRLPWGHKSRRCIYCGKVGPRTRTVGGWAHIIELACDLCPEDLAGGVSDETL